MNARLLGVLALAGIARLPFLSAGFGSDPDAWWVAVTARAAHERIDYVLSRVPGHPVLDVLNALVIPWGPLALNGVSALFSLAAAALFHRLAVRFGVARPALWTLAFAFVPLVYLQSVQSLDYLPALAFLLLSIELACAGRYGFAGVALGFATGCRITSLAMLVPLFVLVPRDVRVVSRLALAALSTAAALYVPVVLSEGWSVFRFVQTPYPPLAFLLKSLTLDVFGIVGLAAAALALVVAARGRGDARLDALVVAALAVFGLAFLRLPDDAAYLLPVVPLVLLWLASRVRGAAAVAVCACLVLSPFVLKVRNPRRVGGPTAAVRGIALPGGYVLDLPGAIFADRARRLAGMRYAAAVLDQARALPPRSLLVVGDWYPVVAWSAPPEALGRITQFPDPGQLAAGREGRLAIRVLPELGRAREDTGGPALRAAGATPLVVP